MISLNAYIYMLVYRHAEFVLNILPSSICLINTESGELRIPGILKSVFL